MINRSLPWNYDFKFVVEEISNINDKSQVSKIHAFQFNKSSTAAFPENEVSFMNCSDYKRNLCYVFTRDRIGTRVRHFFSPCMHFEVAEKVG